MELITILVMSIIILVTLAILIKFNFKSIKQIKEIGESRELNSITDVLPENEQICKEILAIIKNENVTIKAGNENSQTSLYIVATNSIIIANIKNTCARVQTIAHECIHSIQSKRLLWFNFIFSNIYLMYFAVITILALFNKLPNASSYAIVLVMMSILLFFVRSYIETDAMIRARFLAEVYMKSKRELISEENIDLVVENYNKINDFGVKLYNFKLLFDYLLKVVIFCVVSMV